MPEVVSINEKEMPAPEMTEPTQPQPQSASSTSKFAAVIGVCSLALSIGYIVYIAGGLNQTVNKHSEEIRALQRDSPTRDDIRRLEENILRLEGKIDQINDREIRRNR